MTQKKYTGYTIEELLHDQEFVSVVKGINTPEDWEQFLQDQNESRNAMLQAKKIILLFKTNEGILPDDKKNNLWHKIYRFNTEQSGSHRFIKLKTFVRIAASILLFISLGGVCYVHFNKAEIHYKFSESRYDLKTDKPLVVLSNGTKIELEKSESKIRVLKGQDAIQINNDSIVKNHTSVDQTTHETKFIEVIIPFGKKSKLIGRWYDRVVECRKPLCFSFKI
jgi:hypothetical protein